MMRLLVLLPVLVLTACSGSRDTVSPSWDSPFSVQTALVDGDSLRVTVQYGGGFRDHAFRLVSSGAATKSLPRQQPLTLEHQGNGDPGRALITQDKAFDLRPFRDPSQGRIVLLLGGWNAPLEYVYSQ
jgi:hypothetical protein